MTYQKINKNISDVLNQEALAIQNVAQKIPKESHNLIEYILNTSGRIVFSGMGKSGFVARKLAATFSSMGKPSLFLHPSEALHGDLGMLKPNDLFIALSKSGTGKEFEQIFKDVVVATKMDFKMTNSFELYLFIGNEGGKL